MARSHTDLSRVAISVAPSPATSGTSLGVTDANAAYLPDTYPFWAVLVPVNAAPTRANSEIVKVTAGSSSGGTTTYTIVRAQGTPVTTAKTVTTSFDIYDANSTEASAVSAAGNADTVDGVHANDYGGTDGQLVADYGGWKKVTGSWSYASASTITVPSGAASIYGKGDRIRLKQGAGYKYYVIVTVADTLLTVAVNTDYTVANSAITDMYFSHEANPLGYPHEFTYAPTHTGFSANPTVTARYSVIGNIVFLNYVTTGAGTSNANTFTITVPVTASASVATTNNYYSIPRAQDNGAEKTTSVANFASTTVLNLYTAPSATVWTTSGNKFAQFSLFYDF